MHFDRQALMTRGRLRSMRIGATAAIVAVSVQCGTAPTGPDGDADPAMAVVITSDIVRFWEAYDAGAGGDRTTAFQTRYLDKASAGLADFVRLRSVTAMSLVQMVSAFPKYFQSIRAANLGIASNDAVVARIRANYSTIKSLYPAAVFPPLTFVVGRFSTGGTISNNGILIGSEFYSVTAGTPVDELGLFQKANVKPLDSLPVIVSHEHAHVLQLRGGGVFTRSNKSLLEQSLMEGGADFIGELSSRGNINSRQMDYGLVNEAALWNEFKVVMRGTDVSQWLYNQGSVAGNTPRPGDLGYFIGYRITQAYYERHGDKRAALRDIITMKDADAFLAESGYAPSPVATSALGPHRLTRLDRENPARRNRARDHADK
ncbi:MAG TPA: DUF2268 domain-containing putative Zn-dependent protease [Gemmatimonadaceae bacterium]